MAVLWRTLGEKWGIPGDALRTLSVGRAGGRASAREVVGTVPEIDGSLAAGRPLGLVIVVAIGVLCVIAGVLGYLRLRRHDGLRRKR